MRRDDIPASFIKFVQRVGQDFSLVQGLGGNCSVKSLDTMFVKSSGRRMREADRGAFFHEVRLTSDGNFADDVSSAGTTPSIEVFLHASIPEKYVLHLHSTSAIAALMQIDDSDSNYEILESHGIASLPYLRPGKDLLRGLNQQSSDARSGLLLANHGLVISDNTVRGLKEKLIKIEEVLQGKMVTLGHASATRLGKEFSVDEAKTIRWHMAHNWRVTPDHIVFLGVTPRPEFLAVENFDCRSAFLTALRSSGTLSSIELEHLEWYVMLARMLGPRRELPTIDYKEAKSLIQWEPELRRKAMLSEPN